MEENWQDSSLGPTEMSQPVSNYADFIPQTSIEEGPNQSPNLDFSTEEDKTKRVRGSDGKFKKKGDSPWVIFKTPSDDTVEGLWE